MIRVIQHNCARSYEWTIVALETGDARRADIVCLQNAPRERGGIGIGHSSYERGIKNRVWTAIRRVSGMVVDERTDLSRGANDDVIHIDLKRIGETVTWIVNVYNQRDTQSAARPA